MSHHSRYLSNRVTNSRQTVSSDIASYIFSCCSALISWQMSVYCHLNLQRDDTHDLNTNNAISHRNCKQVTLCAKSLMNSLQRRSACLDRLCIRQRNHTNTRTGFSLYLNYPGFSGTRHKVRQILQFQKFSYCICSRIVSSTRVYYTLSLLSRFHKNRNNDLVHVHPMGCCCQKQSRINNQISLLISTDRSKLGYLNISDLLIRPDWQHGIHSRHLKRTYDPTCSSKGKTLISRFSVYSK